MAEEIRSIVELTLPVVMGSSWAANITSWAVLMALLVTSIVCPLYLLLKDYLRGQKVEEM